MGEKKRTGAFFCRFAHSPIRPVAHSALFEVEVLQ
jgi:hypothetical protein